MLTTLHLVSSAYYTVLPGGVFKRARTDIPMVYHHQIRPTVLTSLTFVFQLLAFQIWQDNYPSPGSRTRLHV